jgi:hypothetical protein
MNGAAVRAAIVLVPDRFDAKVGEYRAFLTIKNHFHRATFRLGDCKPLLSGNPVFRLCSLLVLSIPGVVDVERV